MEQFPWKVLKITTNFVKITNHVSLDNVPLKKRGTISNETWFVILTIFP